MAAQVAMVSRSRDDSYRRGDDEDPLDKVLKGLSIAQGVFGIASNIQNIQAAKDAKAAKSAEAEQAKTTLARKESGKYTEPEYEQTLGSGKFVEIEAPKEGEKMPTGVLRRTVIGPEGERSVLLRQVRPVEMESKAAENEATRQAREKLEKNKQDFLKTIEDRKQANKQKLDTLRSKGPAGKEPTPTELQKVEQAEAMIKTNERLDELLNKFDPTSRLYMGQSKLPYGAKAGNWQSYETSARQFLDPIARARTGAAMPESEFNGYMQQFFPMPGDSEEDVLHKQFMREKAIDEVMSQGRRARPQSAIKPPAPAPQQQQQQARRPISNSMIRGNKPMKASQLPPIQ
jgi:hypothetical protein